MNRMRTPILLGLAAAFFLTLGAHSAHADDDTDRLGSPTNAEAQELLDKGNRHYRVKEFEKAIEFYKQGALVEDAPVFLYNLGQCYRQLGEYEDAIWHYRRFLDRHDPDEEVRMYVEDFIKVMKEKLEQQVKDQPPTEPGDADQKQRDKDKSSGNDARVKFDSPEPWYRDKVGWAQVGTGAVAGLVGAGFLMNAASLDDDASNELDEQTRQDLTDKASSRRTIGTILTIGGGALLVAGIIKLAVTPKASRSETGMSVSIGASWIGVAGSF